MIFDFEKITEYYSKLPQRMLSARQRHPEKPLTLTEKILFAHATVVTEDSLLHCQPDRVAMHDAMAQLILLQFALTGKNNAAIPATVHCDRFIIAESGATGDLARALEEQSEIIEFLRASSSKYGFGFWEPGSGIIHQLLLENYAFPGGLLLGTDPHIPNAGGMGMLALNINGCDAVDVLAGGDFEVHLPKVIGICLTGSLQGWAAPKDLILKLASIFNLKVGKGAILEYFGPGAESLSATGKATLCNMSAELGAISSVFPYDRSMSEYLKASFRADVANLADRIQEHLRADDEVLNDPEAFYEQVFEINLSALEPHIAGPYSPDLVTPLSEFAGSVAQNAYPEKLSLALIGSCVNSSYEDLQRASTIARQAMKHGLKVKSPLMISVGSEKVKATLQRDGLWDVFEEIGATFIASACGPCLGQMKRHDVPFGEKNSIMTTYNRNFSGCNDGNPSTHAFLASPEIVLACALAGSVVFNPIESTLLNAQGLPVKFSIPTSHPFPPLGYVQDVKGFSAPAEDGSLIQVIIDPMSERLQPLKPFEPFYEKSFLDLRLLVKMGGKCTMEQISPQGKWLKYRGHLDNISDNLFSLVSNALREEIGRGKNLLTNVIEPFFKVARDYSKEGIGWLVVAEENYGEGHFREHAAMSLRHLGGKAVIAKSYFHPHEMQLKKQGILTLTFQRPEDYDKIREDDLIDILGLSQFDVGSSLELLLKHTDGITDRLPVVHSFTEAQLSWFKSGSSINAFA